jgi:hypothetical protein
MLPMLWASLALVWRARPAAAVAHSTIPPQALLENLLSAGAAEREALAKERAQLTAERRALDHERARVQEVGAAALLLHGVGQDEMGSGSGRGFFPGPNEAPALFPANARPVGA